MCGIVGYIGSSFSKDDAIKGLKRLEYRGYDSSGISIKTDAMIETYRSVGFVSDLEDKMKDASISDICIGHTRWATHGEPSERNAHPHTSSNGRITIVHNGIIENYQTLKKKLVECGYTFSSDTDTEVLANWIDFYRDTEVNLTEAVRTALRDVVGAYAIVVIETDTNDVVMARKSSPLAIGICEKGGFAIASDATPIVEYTKEIVYLDDEQIATISGLSSLKITDFDSIEVDPIVDVVEMELDVLEMGGYDSFMLKEINEQPDSVKNCLRGRLTPGSDELMLGGLEDIMPRLLRANKIFIVACGTSWHAGLIGKTIIESICRIPVEVDYASEFRYRNPIIGQNDVVIAISQSGETADTKAALEMAKERGAILFGVVNVVGSSISRMVDSGIYTHSGLEIGVASTKAFTGQVTALTLLAIKLASQLNSISEDRLLSLKRGLKNIPDKISVILNKTEEIFSIADQYSKKEMHNFLYLGRGVNFPIALEGALKLKEISYIHAEGYPAGEMKHGPIALIDENCPSVFIAPNDKSYDKVFSNIQEIKARGGKVISIVTKGDEAISKVSDHVIEVDETDEMLTPLLTVIPLQLLSYKIALNMGKDVDKPRNLAKSVTVE